ncbi:MAG: hypothetical protein SGPRY_012966, partial [Prymnesium sp.]
MENAHFNNQQITGATGTDRARGKICVKMLPSGIIRRNVFHNNQGFGWYLNNGFPLRVGQLPTSAGSPTGAEGGLVYDWASCSPVQLTDGRDNSAPYTIETPELPGGDGLVEFRQPIFHEGAGVKLNHHCNVNDLPMGGLCASHYLFTGPSHPHQIYSEAGGQTSALVSYGGFTRYLLGRGGANVAFDASRCGEEVHFSQRWGVCADVEYQLRVIKIYSPDRGSLTVTSDG